MEVKKTNSSVKQAFHDPSGTSDRESWLLRNVWYVSLGILVFVIGLWVATVPFAIWLSGWLGFDDIGQSGDLYGSANALFSALALAGVCVAILLQVRELRIQRTELKQMEAAQRASSEALAERNNLERKLMIDRLTIDLVREWQDPRMQIRIEAVRKYVATQDPKRVLSNPRTWTGEKPEKDGIKLLRILQFYERCHVLMARQLVDSGVLEAIIGPHLKYLCLYVMPRVQSEDEEFIRLREAFYRLVNALPGARDWNFSITRASKEETEVVREANETP